jgi:hypothetical protein
MNEDTHWQILVEWSDSRYGFFRGYGHNMEEAYGNLIKMIGKNKEALEEFRKVLHGTSKS